MDEPVKSLEPERQPLDRRAQASGEGANGGLVSSPHAPATPAGPPPNPAFWCAVSPLGGPPKLASARSGVRGVESAVASASRDRAGAADAGPPGRARRTDSRRRGGIRGRATSEKHEDHERHDGDIEKHAHSGRVSLDG